MSPIAVAYFISAIAVMQWLEDWYLSNDIDYQEGSFLVGKWICWGTCRSLSRTPAYDFRYFRMKLPCYQWMAGYQLNGIIQAQLTVLMFAGRWRICWINYQ